MGESKRRIEQLGDGPIEPKYKSFMEAIAAGIDDMFNGTKEDRAGEPRKTGFVLLVFPFDSHEGRCNYISNGADRKDIVILMKEQIKRFEGQAEVTGHA
jgi:hypothetical protein